MLKFSGDVLNTTEFPTNTSFLADRGIQNSAGNVLGLPPNYHFAVPRSVQNMTAQVGFLNPGASVTIDLLKNGSPVPGFSLTFVSGGSMTAVAGPVPFAIGDLFDIRVTASGTDQIIGVSVTLGVE